jgi:urease accessory protein
VSSTAPAPAAEPPAVHGDGLLELRFRLTADGRTVLSRRRQRFPLRITVPLELDPAVPGMAFVYVQNPTGGVFAGDRLSTVVEAGPGTRVHLTTPAATRVYAMDGGLAEQRTRIDVGPGAFVESIPEPLVPHAGSRLRSRQSVTLAEGAGFVCTELVGPGRLARGEAFAYELLDLETEVRGADGRLLCVDRIRLDPGRRAPAARGLLGGPAYLGSLLALTPGRDAAELASTIDRRLDSELGSRAAAGALPGDVGVVVRALTPTAATARSALRIAWGEARAALLGAPLPPWRK